MVLYLKFNHTTEIMRLSIVEHTESIVDHFHECCKLDLHVISSSIQMGSMKSLKNIRHVMIIYLHRESDIPCPHTLNNHSVSVLRCYYQYFY